MESSPNSVNIVSEDFLRISCKLFYVLMCFKWSVVYVHLCPLSVGGLCTLMCFKWSVKKYNVVKTYLQFAIFHYYMKIILLIIPATLVITNSVLFLCFPLVKTRIRIQFAPSRWSGNEKYFWLLLYFNSCIII